MRLGHSGLFVDLEAVYVKGDEEIIVRDRNFTLVQTPPPRACPSQPGYDQINIYTNEGRSEYKALVASLNGTLKGGHFVTASFTFADKKNITDDFSPEFPYGYPSDPADIEAEWGRSRGDERLRFVRRGVFRLPWGFTVAPMFEYGSGQPWTPPRLRLQRRRQELRPRLRRRPQQQDGPDFRQLNLRVTKAFTFGGSKLELIAEGFNVFDTVNYDVNSIDSGALPVRADGRQPGGGSGEEPQLRQVHRDPHAARDPARPALLVL